MNKKHSKQESVESFVAEANIEIFHFHTYNVGRSKVGNFLTSFTALKFNTFRFGQMSVGRAGAGRCRVLRLRKYFSSRL